MRLFSYGKRPVHLGPYPCERLARDAKLPDLSAMPSMTALQYHSTCQDSLVNAMTRYAAMFDLVRDGPINPEKGEVPSATAERANHIKAAGYYFDASLVGVCALPQAALLEQPITSPEVSALGDELASSQPTSFAAGMDMILADVLESARAKHPSIAHHSHAIVLAIEYPRDPRADEPGIDWIGDAQMHRAALLASQTAVLLSNYLRLLGFEARAHSASCSDVDLPRLAVAAGLSLPDGTHPYLGSRYGLAAVTTNFEMAADWPLATQQKKSRSHGLAWQLGIGSLKGKANQQPYANRDFKDGAYPFESITRQAEPTTFIDHDRVPRFPKRADFFARSLFGDLGSTVQDQAKNAHYVMKSPIGACARRALGALLLLQFGGARGDVSPRTADPVRNANNLKAASYFLGVDAVGLCAAPEWVYYSHDAGGNALPAYHKNAINLLIDQGHETMDGASGDDWISVAQSMRAYLRFSLMGGVIAEQVRRLGYSARVHSVLDGDVLQPPLLLLSGLGEVSRIGEVILNPFLGPRLKSGTVTTDLPMQADLPINFGLQNFCESCNKCARECPSGAITAGPKLMYNGYEIWKSDAEKCTRYRITNAAGGMCGRCMKTCPWNLEGLLADSLWRQIAIKLPAVAPVLARLDDQLNRGDINPIKTWWWDIELDPKTGRYVQAAQTNRRGLQKELKLRYEEQTLAVYPADKMPQPYPVPHPVNREEGIVRYRSLLTPVEYRMRLASGQTTDLAPGPAPLPAEPPVFPVQLVKREDMVPAVAKYEFQSLDGTPLPAFEAGAHIDVVVAPEYLRQFSLAGDPADSSKYVLGVLREPTVNQGGQGRGGSALMHRVFKAGRRVFISRPTNHFPLVEDASESLFFAGGIGVTPLIAMAHRLHRLDRNFTLHYSAKDRTDAGFLDDLRDAPWAGRVHYHFSNEGTRADLSKMVPAFATGMDLYVCGSSRYMDAVFAIAKERDWPDANCHREYFTAPETPAWTNHPFKIKLMRSGKVLKVGANQTAVEALAAVGVILDVKCSDGLCGVCATPFDAAQSDAVQHRDFVLTETDRSRKIILCCSRTAEPDQQIVLDL